MDEVSPSGETSVWEVCGGGIREWRLRPADYGLAHDALGALAGGEPAENAARIEALFAGREAPVVRAAVVLNAAAGLYVAGRGWSFEEAVRRAVAAIEDGSAGRALAGLRKAAPRRDP
jgi:anthranilate phosphoribosyltransferase